MVMLVSDVRTLVFEILPVVAGLGLVAWGILLLGQEGPPTE